MNNYYDMTINEISDLIKKRRFQIWINAYIYYRLNNNIISNKQFDDWSEELCYLQKTYPEISMKTDLYEMFRDYEYSSDAAALPFDNNPSLHSRAVHLLENWQNSGK